MVSLDVVRLLQKLKIINVRILKVRPFTVEVDSNWIPVRDNTIYKYYVEVQVVEQEL